MTWFDLVYVSKGRYMIVIYKNKNTKAMKFLNFLRNLFGKSENQPIVTVVDEQPSIETVESAPIVEPVVIIEDKPELAKVQTEAKVKKTPKPKKPKEDKPVETAKEIKAKAKKAEPSLEKKVVKKSPVKKPAKKKPTKKSE